MNALEGQTLSSLLFNNNNNRWPIQPKAGELETEHPTLGALGFLSKDSTWGMMLWMTNKAQTKHKVDISGSSAVLGL